MPALRQRAHVPRGDGLLVPERIERLQHPGDAHCVHGLGVGNMVSLPGLLVGREFSPAQFASVVSLVTATNQVAFA